MWSFFHSFSSPFPSLEKVDFSKTKVAIIQQMIQLGGLNHMYTFLLRRGWPAAKWLWQRRELCPNWGSVWSLPFPYADTLKKEIIFKKAFWLHFRTHGRVSKKEPHQASRSFCTPMAFLLQRSFIGPLHRRNQVLEASGPCQQFCWPHFCCLQVV